MSDSYEVVCDTSDRTAWLEARLGGISASDAGSVMNDGRETPFELWAQKTGREEAPDLDDEEYVWMGNLLEPVVRAAFERKSGWRTSLRPGDPDPQWTDKKALPGPQQLLRSKQWPWLLATIDAWTLWIPEGQSVGIWIPLELKTTAFWGAKEWEAQVPPVIWWQLQAQMAVTNSPRCVVACLVAGNKTMWEVVERDDDAIARYVTISERLWKHIQDDTTPEHMPTKKTASTLYPPGTEVEEVAELSELRWLTVDEEIVDTKAQIKLLKARQEQLEGMVCEAMGHSNEAQLANGVRYRWKTQTRKPHVVKGSTFRRFIRLKSKD